jgi:2-haloacid dehalogenase
MFGLGRPERPKVVAFDIIGTTFSLEPLRPRLEELGLPGSTLERLYAETLRDAMALAAAGSFAPFIAVMTSALKQILAEHELTATDDELTQTLGLMRALPPHPDARKAFETLRKAGIRNVALSNGAASATHALFDRAGLTDLVDQILSVDDVKLSKPRPEVYRYAVEQARVQPAQAMLVATHPWDVNGAKAAGLLGGYVCRGRPYPDTIMKAPDVEGDTLHEVALAIVDMKA